MGKLLRNLIKHHAHIKKRHFFGPHNEYEASGVQTWGAGCLKWTAQNRQESLDRRRGFLCISYMHLFRWEKFCEVSQKTGHP